MTLPAFKPQIDKSTRTEIDAQLAKIEQDNDVRILFAIESGSRAWGFPSPDSDYDVRFVYAHPRDWYLTLEPGRDVIELPIDKLLDINGWDLRKALSLALKPNPVLLEWLASPIRYRWDAPACEALISLSEKVAHRTACRYHYLSLGESQWRRHIGDATEVKMKKYFYILRPALALRWLRMNMNLPPMNLHDLIAGIDLAPPVVDTIADLLEQKAKTREIGTGARIPEIDALINAEFSAAREMENEPKDTDHRAEADALFRSLLAGEIA